MKRARQAIGYWLWDLSSWVYPYAEHKPDEVEQRGWEVSFYFEATEAEADAAFERVSGAICGAEHRGPEHCPMPHVGGMHPAGWSLNHLDAEGLAMELRSALGAVTDALGSSGLPLTPRVEMAAAVARDKTNAYDRAVDDTEAKGSPLEQAKERADVG